ncbi:MAG: dTMP kinase, partial [Treponema sp.]|nr:dTMP kinase [Treponema sp.]
LLKEKSGIEGFMFTAEPTEGETGKFLRKMLSGAVKLEASTAAYLFAADRNEHIYGRIQSQGHNLTSGIMEACKSGKTVVSDRYIFSSLAYQGISCSDDLPYELNLRFPLPQLLFYFDIDPAISLKRIKNRDTKEIYEEEGFLKQVVKGYKAAIERLSRQETDMEVVTLDATRSMSDLSEQIWKKISTVCTAPNPGFA